MFSVSFREGLLLLAILAAFLTGVMVKHWRDAHRAKPASTQAHTLATPR